jgi:poly-beta-1,6-N-acetyl-D-glucosamine biosynthesis protein PgaD
MDQSGSRNKTQHTPLIINRPDLNHPIKRVIAVIATIMAWGVWLYLWVPFVLDLGRRFGFDLPGREISSQISLDSFMVLLRVMPYVFIFAVLIVMVGLFIEKLRARFPGLRTRWRPVGKARLVTGDADNSDRIASWQSARVLSVEHGPLGRVIHAHELTITSADRQ